MIKPEMKGVGLMTDNLRIGCAVPAVALADVHQNTQRICAYMDRAAEAGCDVLVFPELALTGASCGDLYCQHLLTEKAEEGLRYLKEFTARFPAMTVVVGLPVRRGDAVYNCAAVLRGGALLGMTGKENPQRPFADGRGLGENRRIYPLPHGRTMAVIIGDEPVAVSADLTVHPAAALELAGEREQRRKLAASFAGLYAWCSAGWGESVTDGVYSGHSLIARDGCILAENEALADGDYLLTARESDPATPYEPEQRPQMARMPFYTGFEGDVFQIQAAGLAQRLQMLNAHAVVGVSGGLDSTLALLVAAEAMHRLGKPASCVHAVTMPGFGTTDRTYDNAMQLMRLLGVTVREIPIRAAVEQHFLDIGHDRTVRDLTYENAQARERTQILMDYAGRIGGIVVGTGDMSELALGWCTYNGDHMSMYGVNASVPKTLIPEIIRCAAKLPRYAAAEAVLQDIIDTPISPELLPPDERGNIAQQTEDLVGPYILQDFFLYHVLQSGSTPREIFENACRVFPEFDTVTIKKWLRVFYRRFFTQQFKRSCMPEGVKVSRLSLSPRGDWQMPGDADAALWLAEIDRL